MIKSVVNPKIVIIIPAKIGAINPSQGLIPRRLRRYAFIIDA